MTVFPKKKKTPSNTADVIRILPTELRTNFRHVKYSSREQTPPNKHVVNHMANMSRTPPGFSLNIPSASGLGMGSADITEVMDQGATPT
jgi:hypothetical protein